MIKLPTKLWLRRTISNSIMGYFFLSYSRKTKSKASGFNNVAVSLWLSTKYADLRVALSWTCLKKHFFKDDFCCPTTNRKVALQQSYKQFSVSWAVKVRRGRQDWRYAIRVSVFWIVLCMAPKTAVLCIMAGLEWEEWDTPRELRLTRRKVQNFTQRIDKFYWVCSRKQTVCVQIWWSMNTHERN